MSTSATRDVRPEFLNFGIDAPIYLPPLVLGIAAAVLRFVNLDGKQLWTDELIQIEHSRPGSFLGILRGVTLDRGGTPLDYLVQHVVMSVVGVDEFGARVHAAIFGSLTVAMVYCLCRLLFAPNVSLIAGILYAVYPLHHHYSQEGRPYALFVFLTVTAYFLFIKCISNGSARYWAMLAITLTLSLYTSYYTIFVIFSQTVFLVLCRLNAFDHIESFVSPSANRIFAKYLLCAFAALICFAPWTIFGVNTVYGYEPSPETFNLRLLTRVIKELGNGSFPLAGIYAVAIGFGIRQFKSINDHGWLALLIAWGALPLPLIFLLLWYKDYFFAIRQVLFMTPALVIIAAYGIVRISELFPLRPGLSRKVSVLLFALLITASLVVIGLHVDDRRPDIRAAAHFVQSRVLDFENVMAPGLAPGIEFYAPELSSRLLIPDEGCGFECLLERKEGIYVLVFDNLSAHEKEALSNALASC